MDWIGDVAIPIVAILVPTTLAIWLARSERLAAARDRAGERERTRELHVAAGVEFALDAMSDLLEAGYTDDIRLAAAIRIRAARKLAKIQTRLGTSNQSVTNWATKELGIVSAGLEDRDQLNLPVMLEQMGWRSALFVDVLLDWQTGEKDLAWFDAAVHASLASSVSPEFTPLP